MKRTAILVAVCVLLVPLASFADEALYKAKCVACHGADGKKSAKVDLTSAKVLDKTDAELVKFLTTHAVHKAKVPGEAEAKTVVTYIRTLKN